MKKKNDFGSCHNGQDVRKKVEERIELTRFGGSQGVKDEGKYKINPSL